MEKLRSERHSAPRALLGVAGAAAVATAIAIVLLDRPLARLIAETEASEVWTRGMELLEWLVGYPLHPLLISFVLVGATVATMVVPRLRPLAPAAIFLSGTHVFARYAMIQLKDLTGRLRPVEWLAQGGDDTFFRGGVSFPSGHVTLFAGLAIPIAMLAPRAWPVLFVPVFVAGARIAVNAHFLGDTVGALALVALIAWLVALGARPFRR